MEQGKNRKVGYHLLSREKQTPPEENYVNLLPFKANAGRKKQNQNISFPFSQSLCTPSLQTAQTSPNTTGGMEVLC